VVLSRATLHACGAYRCNDMRIESHVVKTNSVPYGAFRGFGAPQAIFAMELHMSRAAVELEIDPAAIRRKNFLHEGDSLPTGQILKDEPGLERLMDRALSLSRYREKRAEFDDPNKRPGEKRRGIGLSVFFHGCGFTGSGEVRLASQLSMRLTEQGGVEI